jgi:hypothetical protein
MWEYDEMYIGKKEITAWLTEPEIVLIYSIDVFLIIM